MISNRVRAVPLLIYCILVVATFSIEYPGQLNLDSLDQLTQAAHPEYLNDWHSPGVSWFWSLAASLLGQPSGALAIQSAMLMAFPAIVLSEAIGRKSSMREKALWIAYAIFLLSWVPIAGLILKDSFLLGLIAISLAIVKTNRLKPSFKPAALAGPMFAVCLVRPTNFLLIGLTLACAAGALMHLKPMRVGAVAAVFAMTLLAATIYPVISRSVFRANDAHAAEQLIIFDAAGISTESGVDLFQQLPAWPAIDLPRPWLCYIPNHWDTLAWWGQCRGYVLAFEALRPRTSNLSQYIWWARIIASNPVSYLKHRSRYVAALLWNTKPFISAHPVPENSIGSPSLSGTSSTHGVDMRPELQIWTNSGAKIAFSAATVLFQRPRFIPLLSTVTCLTVLVLLRLHVAGGRTPATLVAAAAASIGLANVAMLALFGVADDARYLTPTISCAYIAFFELALAMMHHRRTSLDIGPDQKLRNAPGATEPVKPRFHARPTPPRSRRHAP